MAGGAQAFRPARAGGPEGPHYTQLKNVPGRTVSRGPDKFSGTLVFSYKRLDAKAAADETILPGIVEPALAKLQGVEVKGSKLDIKAKEVRIRLDGKGGAKLADIKAAFPGLALE